MEGLGVQVDHTGSFEFELDFELLPAFFRIEYKFRSLRAGSQTRRQVTINGQYSDNCYCG